MNHEKEDNIDKNSNEDDSFEIQEATYDEIEYDEIEEATYEYDYKYDYKYKYNYKYHYKYHYKNVEETNGKEEKKIDEGKEVKNP